MHHSATIREALEEAEAAYSRDAERDSRLGTDDPYRPFDIAVRAIQLLYPGTKEEDIELPAFENPRVPSARKIVKDYIEQREADEALKRPRLVVPPAPKVRQAVVYGEINGELLFVPKNRAEELVAAYRAMREAQTWGDFRRLAPQGAYDELVGMMEDPPAAGEAFDQGNIEPIVNCEFPGLVAQEMFRWIPDDIIEKFGTIEQSMFSGDMLAFDPDDEVELLEALAAAGFDCERNDDVVRVTAGY